MSVKLIIKSAAQCVDDFVLNCELSWTIDQVKEEISRVYPTNPNKEQQKLIYAGKLLPNEHCLQSFLNQDQDFHVFHLVCPLPLEPERDCIRNKEKTTQPVYASPPPFDMASMNSQMNSQFLSSLGVSGGVPLNPTMNVQQYFALQQIYTQMVSQYFSQVNGNPAYIPSPVPAPSPVAPAETQGQAVVPDNHPRQADIDEGIREEFYVFLRIFMFSCLLFFYTSLSRLIGLTFLIIFITVLAKIKKRQQRRAEAQRILNNVRQNMQPATNGNEDSVSEQEIENAARDGSTDSTTPANSPSIMATIFTLISAFFTSLIPNDPLPINVN